MIFRVFERRDNLKAETGGDMADLSDDDQAAIRKLVGDHFEGMTWSSRHDPDWARFEADFLPEAQLFPAARPVQVRGVQGFIQRMQDVAMKNLESFEEHTKGMRILGFGNIAVVLAHSEMLENEQVTNHDVSGYLLVKTEGHWKIAAHAWDQAGDGKPVPSSLL